ncbi:MAG: FCD domain-containing protein, partial [Bryobacteraceae bacterium]
YSAGKAAEHTLRQSEVEAFENVVGEVLRLRDELLASGDSFLHADGMRRFIRIDLQFHTLLVRAAANARLMKVFADTRVLLNIFGIRRAGHDAAQLTEIHRYHSEILAAILARDPKAAKRLLSEHIQVSKLERLQEFDEREREIALGHHLPEMYSIEAP